MNASSPLLADAAALPTLTGQRVRLRWVTPADAPALFEIFGDPAVARYMDALALRSPDEADALIDDIHRLFAERSLFQWGTEVIETGEIVGHVTLADLDTDHGRTEIGYSLARRVWGSGYATEATRLAIAFGFDTLGLRRVEAEVDPRNIPSLRLLTRLGFRREGLARERCCVGGELQDSVMFGLLAREFIR